MAKTIDRIIELVGNLGMSARQFDISIGASNGYTLRMRKNNASVGSDVIEKIVETYPHVNLVWLITGKGPMFTPTKKSKRRTSTENITINKKILSKLESDKKALLQELLDEINSLDVRSR